MRSSSSSSSSRNRADDAKHQAHQESLLENDNDQKLDELNQRISKLKEISIGIHQEAKGQNSLLDKMDTQFGKARGLLGGTVQKLVHMMGTKNGKEMLYMFVVCMLIFSILWKLWSKSQPSEPEV
eukprot:GILI01019736.1.p1 GENE.GILI01019736.1~~GILI01019736.1.p1  ORF type:complete len:125 (-),score=24.96 GILI01019736.1:257-631(-)